MDLREALHTHFGFADFRGMQRAVVERFLAGGDALVIMATGEGKSLCYQLPAFAAPGLTLVVSPLIALMDDQVASLRRRGLPATCIHSLLDRREREQRMAAALTGDVKLLYVTPERFRVPGFLEAMRSRRVARLAVDEAHCVSHWGHDFRPDYLHLGAVREALGNPPCLALTATATPAVQEDIRAQLNLGDAPMFHTGIERANLFLSVQQPDEDAARLARLLQVLDATGGPAIVYCALIADLLRLEGELQRHGIRPLVYHGKLSANERRDQQARFTRSKDALILATNAFGMGVDKPDIRAIVHWQMPGTLEAYYQEIGRAGRDGAPAWCELLYREQDLQVQRNFVEGANPDRRFLLQVAEHLQGLGDRLHALDLDTLRDTFLVKSRHDGRVETCLRLLRSAGCTEGEPGNGLQFVRLPTDAEVDAWIPADKRKQDLMGLLAMVRYATGTECRKRAVHAHFGFDLEATDCGACDVCTDGKTWLATHFAVRQPVPRGEATLPTGTAGGAPVERGQWIDVKGLGLCAVKRVHHAQGVLRVDVEVARDLSERSVDLRRTKWRPVRHES